MTFDADILAQVYPDLTKEEQAEVDALLASVAVPMPSVRDVSVYGGNAVMWQYRGPEVITSGPAETGMAVPGF